MDRHDERDATRATRWKTFQKDHRYRPGNLVIELVPVPPRLPRLTRPRRWHHGRENLFPLATRWIDAHRIDLTLHGFCLCTGHLYCPVPATCEDRAPSSQVKACDVVWWPVRLQA